MKDSSNDDEADARESEESDHTWIEDGRRSVPPNAEWELAAQNPIDEHPEGSLTTTIVSAVAEAEGVSAVDIKEPPLFEVVDTAALEAAFFGSDETSRTGDYDSTTEFMYRDHRVVVRSDGWVLVYDRVDE